VLCYAGIPREKNNQVSSMMNFVRNVGGSIGIAVVGTMVTRETQARQTYLSGHMQNGNPMFRQMVAGLTATLHAGGMNMADANRQAIGRLTGMLEQQAAALAFKDVIAQLVIVVLCLIPLAFVMQKPPARGEVPPPH
jgi:MFS transporter, DHA2 family, multidrug resistance protein